MVSSAVSFAQTEDTEQSRAPELASSVATVEDKYLAVSADEPQISTDTLKLMLKPLTA